MSRLGSYTGTVIVQAFQKAGWSISRQKGSHVAMEKPGQEATLSVPVHKGKEVKRGTLRDLIKDAGMTVDEFVSNL
ncbi:type II toxin-antitoxin system HicA family toxin [Desulfobacter sp.]|uniref:type II toxin-antitoxin system HicA family toxin n=1 Tax=Desulfobacter sp. TaxID=2294 RepID=UPI003D10CA5D